LGGDLPLQARALALRAGGRVLLEGLDLAVAPGDVVAVLGRNGAGKTLLLHTLAGLRAPDGGEVHLQGTSLGASSRREIARRVALLPQDLEPVTDTSALDAVLVGRYAHRSAWRAGDAADLQIARAALQRAGALELAEREFATLSGGEQRRVAAAAVLAQETPLVLLDEPTNHLDPHHAVGLLALFAAHCAAGGSVVTTLHDATLAARHASHVLMLHGDGRWQHGTAAEMLTADALSALYLTPMVEHRSGERRIFTAL
jgi:iron complex transport system ATP-binding protein